MNFNSLYKIWWNRVSWIDWRKDKICWTIQGMGGILLGWEKIQLNHNHPTNHPKTAISQWKRCCHRDLSLHILCASGVSSCHLGALCWNLPWILVFWPARHVWPREVTSRNHWLTSLYISMWWGQVKVNPWNMRSMERFSKKCSLFSSYFSLIFPKNQPHNCGPLEEFAKNKQTIYRENMCRNTYS